MLNPLRSHKRRSLKKQQERSSANGHCSALFLYSSVFSNSDCFVSVSVNCFVSVMGGWETGFVKICEILRTDALMMFLIQYF